MAIRDGIIATANSLGISPYDLATVMSYETAGTFDPTKAGPRTQYGRHRGFIQFGEPQAQQYGVDWSDPEGSQLGENGAVAKYLRDAGVRPGMGLLDIYSAVNAGRVGRYNARDAQNGGAPGTVRDKVMTQMAGHQRKAASLLGGDWSPSDAGGEIMGGTVELPSSVPAPLFYDDAPAALARNSMNPFDLIVPSAQAGEMSPAIQASYEQDPLRASIAGQKKDATESAQVLPASFAAPEQKPLLTPEMQTLAKQLGQSAAAANTPLTAAQRASRSSPNAAPGLTRTTAPTAPFVPTGDGPIPMTDILTPQEKAYLSKDSGLDPNAGQTPLMQNPDKPVWTDENGPHMDFTQTNNLSAAPGLKFADQTPMPRLATEDISMQPNGAVLPGITHTAQPFPSAADNPVTGNSGGGGAQLPSGANAPKPEMNPNYFPPAPKAPGKFNMGNFLGALGMVMGALDQGSPELKGVSLQGYAHKPENTQLPIPKGLLG